MRGVLGCALSVLVALLAPGSARAAAATFEPCRPALTVVRRALHGKGPSGLAGRPLYELELHVHPETGSLEGRMQVTYAARLTTPVAIFTLPRAQQAGAGSPIQVTHASAVVGSGRPTEAAVAVGAGRISVTLPRAPKPGERVAVRLELEGNLPTLDMGALDDALSAFVPGSGPGTLGTLATGARGMTLISPEPLLVPVRRGAPWVVPPARWGAPSPAPVACHLITVLTPKGWDVVGTGVSVGTVPDGDEVRHTRVAAGTRGIGIVIRRKAVARATRKVGGVTIEALAHTGDHAVELAREAAHALRFLAGRYGPYPWSRLVVVTAPLSGAFGGARAPGLVVVNSLLDDGPNPMMAMVAGHDPSADLRELSVVHQLAHQWFGELVATPGPDEPVTEEMLTQHAVLAYANAHYGPSSAATLRRLVADDDYRVMRGMGLSDGAADRSTKALGSYGTWSGLCEGKAPLVFRALAKLMGQDAVERAIGRFARTRRFGFGDRKALVADLVAVTGPAKAARVRATIVHWLDEAHGDEDVGGPMRVQDLLGMGGPNGMQGFGGLGGFPAGALPSNIQDLIRQFEKALNGP